MKNSSLIVSTMDYWENFSNVSNMERETNLWTLKTREFLFVNLNKSDNDLQLFEELTNSTLNAVIFGITFTVALNIFLFGIEIEIKNISSKIKEIDIQFVITSVIVIMATPIIVSVLIFSWFYKQLCKAIISLYDPLFISFLDSTDAFWCLNDLNTKSYINVLAFVDADNSFEIANKLKNKLRTLFANENSNVRKIFYGKSEACGYVYWKYNYNIKIDDYVEIFDVHAEKRTITDEELGVHLTTLSKEILKTNELFKIFITRQFVVKENNKRIGIVFKIHHSVGDGNTLFQLLINNFDDENSSLSNDLPSNHIPKIVIPEVRFSLKLVLEIFKSFVRGIIKKPDENIIHSKTLAGKNIFAWTETNGKTLENLKFIKNSRKGTSITNLLLHSLSKSLNKYLKKRNNHETERISVIVPKQLPGGKNNELANNFGVTLLKLNLDQKTYPKLADAEFYEKEIQIQADLFKNYFFVRLTCGILPRWLLDPIFVSRHATLVFSNVPGPKEPLQICGTKLESLVFFVPNKGTTGLGITVLSYQGVLRFAAMADTSIIDDRNDLKEILNGIVDYIEMMVKNV